MLRLYRVDLNALVSKYIGKTENHVRRLFEAANNGNSILFFDEDDVLFGKRTDAKDSHDRHAKAADCLVRLTATWQSNKDKGQPIPAGPFYLLAGGQGFEP